VSADEVGAKSHFVTDLGLDSLDTVELVMAIEDEFAIEIPDAAAEGILTVEDAVKYISSNVNAK
jgi:acyl carrier protein